MSLCHMQFMKPDSDLYARELVLQEGERRFITAFSRRRFFIVITNCKQLYAVGRQRPYKRAGAGAHPADAPVQSTDDAQPAQFRQHTVAGTQRRRFIDSAYKEQSSQMMCRHIPVFQKCMQVFDYRGTS